MAEFTWTDELVKEFYSYLLTKKEPDYFHGAVQTFKASKQPKPLFTTEDGVDIYEGGTVWFINEYSFEIFNTTASRSPLVNGGENLFSTESAAKEYVLHNKPCLSVKEVMELSTRIRALGDCVFQPSDLIKLAKSKA